VRAARDPSCRGTREGLSEIGAWSVEHSRRWARSCASRRVSMSSAARSVGHAAAIARTLRDASGESARRDARDALAGALRAEAVRVLVVNGIPPQARDDLAQAVTVAVLARIVDGAVAPGFEDGY